MYPTYQVRIFIIESILLLVENAVKEIKKSKNRKKKIKKKERGN